MPTYITLLRFTQQGVEKIKEGPARLERAKAAVKAAGGEMKAFYLTMGQYDAVVINEAPSDEAYAAVMLALGSAGAVRSETLRAFTEEQYNKIIAAIP
ncbi:MAG TPA: GYD domain-containing protein [Anaerolineae bacterium]|nr:GYD domain-containing protein [Anaerolineae bacterium]